MTMHESAPRTLAVVGATATGKSALALAVAARHDGEIVNADALQVYRGFDVGTAKPTADERRRVTHHLVDILEPTEPFSAGAFARLAREAIAAIHARGRLAIVVGGSGLYLRALWSGIAPLPERDETLRAALEAELERDGIEVMGRKLADVDPATAARLGARDAQRILRALEIHRATGVPMSEWLRRAPFGRDVLAVRKVGLTLPRAVLYDRIESRVRRMISQGWVEEVRLRIASGVPETAPAFQAIGYAELLDVVANRSSEVEVVERIVRRTRRFAKRQETWFRRETGIEWIDALRLESQASEIVRAVGTADGGG